MRCRPRRGATRAASRRASIFPPADAKLSLSARKGTVLRLLGELSAQGIPHRQVLEPADERRGHMLRYADELCGTQPR